MRVSASGTLKLDKARYIDSTSARHQVDLMETLWMPVTRLAERTATDARATASVSDPPIAEQIVRGKRTALPRSSRRGYEPAGDTDHRAATKAERCVNLPPRQPMRSSAAQRSISSAVHRPGRARLQQLVDAVNSRRVVAQAGLRTSIPPVSKRKRSTFLSVYAGRESV
jgi:hypothetical protein